MTKHTIRNIQAIKGKSVLLRADYNVPLRFSGGKAQIVDASRIIAGLPTIRYLLRYGAKIAIAAHLGDGKSGSQPEKKLSTRVLAKKLEVLLGQKVYFTNDCIGAKAENAFAALPQKGILLLENLRFHPGEKRNDPEFAKELAKVVGLQAGSGPIYVNDAFSVSHRNHASVSAIKQFLPSFCGLLVEKEVKYLSRALKPDHPAVAVIGGAKISTKLKLITRLASSYDNILIGGAMANNFLKAAGHEVGESLISEADIELAAKLKSPKLLLPVDVIVADKQGSVALKRVADVGSKDIIYDIGPETIRLFSSIIKKAKTIVWNGPLGKFEDKHFKHGTLAVGGVVARRASGQAFAVAGGGETVEALALTGETQQLDWVSTGGGAMLAYLGGEAMPGLEGIC